MSLAMSRQTFVKTSTLPVPSEDLFNWHLREGVFERLSAPWELPAGMRMEGTVESGGVRRFTLPFGPIRLTWIARHTDFQPGCSFVDYQESGPFRSWRHTHRVIPDGPERSILQDEIEYELPLGKLGQFLASSFMRSKLETHFNYRHRITEHDLRAHHQVMKRKTMRILVSGAGGLVGASLGSFLKAGGHTVVPLRRSSSGSGQEAVIWDPVARTCDPAQFNGFDAVIHLAGENIAGGRWNARRKAEIRRSRVDDTRYLAEILAGLSQPPRQLICASAIGYYGPRDSQPLNEYSAGGTSFLAKVCRDWELAAEPAQKAGIAVSHLRFGIILSPAGGALAKMLLPFKMGAGGVLGSGKQYMSWVTLDDVVGAIHHTLAHPDLTGPINVTAPEPVTNAVFTKTLGKVLKRPTIFPVPAFAARLAFGEMADELLLTGSRVLPEKLLGTGYQFQYPDLEAGLRHLLGK